MYRYGDGTPFPLDENFIETLTLAVEACTNAFMPLTELDDRREQAKAARVEADRDVARLTELDKALTAALAPYMPTDAKSGGYALGVAQKTTVTAKQAIQQARSQIDGRVRSLEGQAAAATASEGVLAAMRVFFDQCQLPNAKWILSWDARTSEPSGEATASSGRLTAKFRLKLESARQPIRVDQLADAVVVHMMKKAFLGKTRPAPVDLGKYLLVAFERNNGSTVITLREKPDRHSQGLQFTVVDRSATWQPVAANGEVELEPNPLDPDDTAGIFRLAEGAILALKDLVNHRELVELTLNAMPLARLAEPRAVPMEVLEQLTPLTRTLRERSRVPGELVLKRDLGGGRREELFVPRAQLSQRFAKLPPEYRRPFEDMGVSSEDTQPSIQTASLLRSPPSPPTPSPPTIGGGNGSASTVQVDPDITHVGPRKRDATDE